MSILDSIKEKSFIKLMVIFFFLSSLFLFQSCHSPLNVDDDYNKGYKQGYQDGIKAANNEQTNPKVNHPENNVTTEDQAATNSSIPEKVYETLAYIKKNKRAPDGYVGGRHFGNFEHRLPEQDASGNSIDYKEYDVNPKTEGKTRGAQRLVIGNNGQAWYTNDHYKSFTEVK